jgi:hypothetical protein
MYSFAVASSESFQERRAFSRRAIVVGLVLTVLVCGLTPLNDYVLSDTNLTVGFFPLAAVLAQVLMVLVVNVGLRLVAPRQALNEGELGVVMMMVLIACSLPGWGLMRFLVPAPVAPFFLGSSDPVFWKHFQAMGLPAWLFPVADPARGTDDPVVSWFYRGMPDGESIPWAAWAGPALAWGVFAAAMLTTLVCVARIVLSQWQDNERLAFPLMQIHASLIESPAPGRAVNRLLRSQSLWLALVFVLLLHLSAVGHYFKPRYIPSIPLGYDFTGWMTEGPLLHLPSKVKAATISFTAVGVAFFMRSKVSFSLWSTYLLMSVIGVGVASQGGAVIEDPQWRDIHLGATAAFLAGVLYLGRHHWLLVLRNAFFCGQGNAFRLTFWLGIAGIFVMLAWLVLVGVSVWMAGLIVLFIVAGHLVVSRIVAETGMPMFRTGIMTAQVYQLFEPASVGTRNVFFASVMNLLGALTSRDSTMTMSTHGMALARQTNPADFDRSPWRLGIALALTLLVGGATAATSTLVCHYHWSTPMIREEIPQRNNFGAVYTPQRDVAMPVNMAAAGTVTPKGHDTALAVGTGAGVVGVLQVLALRVSWWPFLPVGIVASYGAFIQNIWYSLLLGWLIKLLAGFVGSARGVDSVKPMMIGVILGESIAALFVLGINALVVFNGHPTIPVKILL